MHRAIIGVLLATAMAGCGGGTAPAAAPATLASGNPAAAPPTSVTAPPAAPRRQLTVALYPYVPSPDVMFADAKTAFEKAHPDVEVLRVDLSDEYYNSKKTDSIKQTSANVMEIDSVFLADLAAKLTPLPAATAPREGDFAKAAVQVASKSGAWLGAPHWLCSDFVFSTKSKPFAGSSLKALEQFVGKHPKDGAGMLAEFMGASTLGEVFLDEVVDRTGTLAAGLALLPPTPLPEKWGRPTWTSATSSASSTSATRSTAGGKTTTTALTSIRATSRTGAALP